VGGWTICEDPEIFRRAFELTKGEYQRNVIRGYQNLSGSTLSSKRRAYSASYAKSRASLLKRLEANGIRVTEQTGILVLERMGPRLTAWEKLTRDEPGV
jgi:hypothetical protein